MPGRTLNSAAGYRYGYNGMEKDKEVSGNGNSYTTQFRQYDPRLGRWKSLDPLMNMFPSISPYTAFDNNPIFYIDPYGLSSSGGDDRGKGKGKRAGAKGRGSKKHGENKLAGRKKGKNKNEKQGKKERDNNPTDTDSQDIADRFLFLAKGGTIIVRVNVVAIAVSDGKPSPASDDNPHNDIDDVTERAVLSATHLDDDVTVIYFKNRRDLQGQMRNELGKTKKLGNLIVIGHAAHTSPLYKFGNEWLGESGMKKFGQFLKGYCDINTKIAFEMCNAAGGNDPKVSQEVMQTIADESGATVIAPLTWGSVGYDMFVSESETEDGNFFWPVSTEMPSSHANDTEPAFGIEHLGQWAIFRPGETGACSILRWIYFTTSGEMKLLPTIPAQL